MPNYIKTAFRNLRKHPFYTILNVFGLSLGIGCGIILFQFISYHLRFDRYHHNADQIYRVVTDVHLDDGTIIYDKGAPMALGAAIQAEVPQVRDQAFLFDNYRDHVFTVAIPRTGGSNKLFSEHGNVAFTDRHWFHLFDYAWEMGDPQTALEEPNTAVLTRKQAEKYFGHINPMGKILRIDGKEEFKITGVLKNHSDNTDFKTDLFLSMPSFRIFYPDMHRSVEAEWGWFNPSNSLFILLPAGLSSRTVDKAISALAREHMAGMAKYYDFHLVALKDLHFDTMHGGLIPRSLLATLAIVGFFILIIACVNFINLATAQNTGRAKEVSTRKILGSSANGIFLQFLFETTCITGLALTLALAWVYLSLPILNQWLQTELELHLLSDKSLMAMLLALIAFVVIAAGFYPAFLLSRFKPVEVLKSKSVTGRQPWLRKSLILLQNIVAQSLIICTLIIMLQNNYLKTADLGFNKEAVLMIPFPKPDKNNLEYLRNQLLKQSDIRDVSFCFRAPASETFKGGSVKFDHRDWENYNALGILGDSHYLGTFGLQLIAGRNLAESDTVQEFLVSEDMIRRLGLSNPSQVLGHHLVYGALDDHPGTIVGVVKDIHLHSLHLPIEPLIITTQLKDYAYAGVRIGTANPGKVIGRIKQIWESIYPDNNFAYRFLDQQINDFYKNEELLNKLIGSFAVVAIIISCLGLLGLISLLTVQRTKEIGIRKVIGASVTNIMIMLSKDFARLVGVALILATAIAWVAMTHWLRGFAYRIIIPWWIFLLAAAGNLALALMTICYHAVKAASMNPIKSLRSE